MIFIHCWVLIIITIWYGLNGFACLYKDPQAYYSLNFPQILFFNALPKNKKKINMIPSYFLESHLVQNQLILQSYIGIIQFCRKKELVVNVLFYLKQNKIFKIILFNPIFKDLSPFYDNLIFKFKKNGIHLIYLLK